MSTGFLIVTLIFVVISVSMVLIILVQRPSGGGLAGAFGGAGGGSDTVFGGRVGDALTWATVIAFLLYMGVAIALNKIESANTAPTDGSAVPASIESPAPQTPGAPQQVTPTPIDPSQLPPELREQLGMTEDEPADAPE